MQHLSRVSPLDSTLRPNQPLLEYANLLLQGCCFSSPSRDNAHQSYATGDTPEDRQPETTPPDVIAAGHGTALLRETTRITRHPSRGSGPQCALEEHFNSPIRQHTWYSKRRTWTRAQLDRERKEFFETRVTGRPEVWAALGAAVGLMYADDMATAQSIIDAAGVTVPTGDLCEGCYDEQGVLYRLPQCIVSDPENMAEEDSADSFSGHDELDGMDDKLATDEASGDELIERKDEKGKARERDLIKVTVRLSDRMGPDLVVSVGKSQNVGLVARKVQQEAGVCSPILPRI